MGHRLSKITTRTGDAGETGLGDGARVPKDSLRIQALGDVDELNCALGLLLVEDLPQELGAALRTIQHDLFDLGGELSIPGHAMLQAAQVEQLEQRIAAWNADLPALKEFVLPGGTRAAATCHLARTISRRAERSAWEACKLTTVNPELLRYLNRLSDLLFVMARRLARQDGGQEVLWRR
jgi:cob(I)alamin adenosyltransferase